MSLRAPWWIVGCAALFLPACQEGEAPAATTGPSAAPLSAAGLPAPYNEADVAAGEGLWAVHKCQTCHFLSAGAGHRIGPNLHGVVGRKAAAAEGFGYSTAFQALDIVWTPEEIDRLITDPKAFAPGTSMFFNGVYDVEERRNLIAYLMLKTAAQ